MNLTFFILSLFQAGAMLYVVSRFLEIKINFKNKKFYLILIFLTLCTFFAYFVTKSFIRSIILLQVYNLCHYYIYHSEKTDFRKITIATISSFIVLLLCEIIVDVIVYIIVTIIFKIEDINYFTNFFGFMVLIVFLFLTNVPRIKKLFALLAQNINTPKTIDFVFCAGYTFLVLTTSLYLIYFNLSELLKFILLILTLIEYAILVRVIIINIKNKEKVQKDLDLTLEVTSKYEIVLNDIRKKNHENKNQLIVIKDLVKSNKKEALLYIDSLLETKLKEDKSLAMKIAKVPSGGLRGLIYYKLLTIKEKNIDCYVEVSKNVSKNILAKQDIELVQAFYKIVGVFLDNAIEALEESKKKIFLIELFVENKSLNIVISNEYTNSIAFKNLGNFRITTKGDNHGYGLQLVKELVNSHPELSNNTEIIGNLFVQKLSMKLK